MLLHFHKRFILDLPEVTLETQVVTAPRDFGAAWCAPGAQQNIDSRVETTDEFYPWKAIGRLKKHTFYVPFGIPNRPNPSQSMQIPLISGL